MRPLVSVSKFEDAPCTNRFRRRTSGWRFAAVSGMLRAPVSRRRPIRSPGSNAARSAPPLLELVIAVPRKKAEDWGALLVELGAGAVLERPRGAGAELVVYGKDRRALAALGRAFAAHAEAAVPIEVRRSAPRFSNWETEWTKDLERVELTPRLDVAPSTLGPFPGRRRTILLRPELVFGFGDHPTTRLAASAVERRCRGGARSVLDVGTGTGVLAIVAAVSGARRVVGVDLSRRAVRAATRNARDNGVDGVCRFASTPVARVHARFDVVVANIGLDVLKSLAPSLVRRVALGGSLLLAGFLDEHARELEATYRDLGFARAAGSRARRESGFRLLELGRIKKSHGREKRE